MTAAAFYSRECFSQTCFCSLLVLVVFTPSAGGMSYLGVVSSSKAHKLNSSHYVSLLLRGKQGRLSLTHFVQLFWIDKYNEYVLQGTSMQSRVRKIQIFIYSMIQLCEICVI